MFLLPVFVQTVQGRSALAAGVAMAPQAVITGLSTALGPAVLLPAARNSPEPAG